MANELEPHKKIYKTAKWIRTRKAVIFRDRATCQICGKLVTHGIEIDHITELTKDNYKDDSIAYGLDNLRVLCHDCHNKRHGRFFYETESIVNEDLTIDYERRK